MVSVAGLIKEMPEGYERACYEEKAIQRKRGITTPGDLMMLSLFHLLNGCSLVEVSTIASLAELGEISDVAFMKRFAKCNDWFKRIISEIVTGGAITYEKPEWLANYRVIADDASDVTEKGRSKRTYRLHYALDLFKMESLQYKITTQKTGETMLNFTVEPNDLFIGDRAYGTANGMEYCLNSGGNFVFRLKKNCMKLYDGDGKTIDLLPHLKSLNDDEALNLNVFFEGNDHSKIPVRVCAIRKTAENIALTKKKLHRKESRKQRKIADATKEFNEYIVLITALPDEITSVQILELYRLRWQVEIYFKRLKSILDFGELPKRRHESVMAWLNGKLMIALLIEKMIGTAVFPPV